MGGWVWGQWAGGGAATSPAQTTAPFTPPSRLPTNPSSSMFPPHSLTRVQPVGGGRAQSGRMRLKVRPQIAREGGEQGKQGGGGQFCPWAAGGQNGGHNVGLQGEGEGVGGEHRAGRRRRRAGQAGSGGPLLQPRPSTPSSRQKPHNFFPFLPGGALAAARTDSAARRNARRPKTPPPPSSRAGGPGPPEKGRDR